ncbi:hypothetical protein Lser_V15G42092 [Lactuca serriola]
MFSKNWDCSDLIIVAEEENQIEMKEEVKDEAADVSIH